MCRFKEITNELRERIIASYADSYSVSDVMRTVPDTKGIGRGRIVKILTEVGLYEGLLGPNQQFKKQEKLKKTMIDKYGIVNVGQRIGGGWASQNNIPYCKISYIDTQFVEYKLKVEKASRKNLRKHPVADSCFYTGIKFADACQRRTNPNDPRKRSVDHKIPILIGYLIGMTVEEIASIDNLTYVLRYVNTVKGNTAHCDFLPIAEKLRKVFENEGY